MSVRLMVRAFELPLSATEKLVLLALADHANADGSGCYPSIPTLMKKTSLSRRCVQQTIRRFEKAGLLVLAVRARGDRAAEYLIDLGGDRSGSKSGGETAQQPRPLPIKKSGKSDVKGAHLTTKRGARDDQIRKRILIEPKPEPTSEPSYVPSGVVTETFPRNPADAGAVGSVLGVGREVPVSDFFARNHHRHPPETATAKSDDDDAARYNLPAQSNSGKPNPASADDASASEKSRLQKLKATALWIFEAKHPGENRRELWEAMLDLIEVRAEGRGKIIASAEYFVTSLERECAGMEIGAEYERAFSDPMPPPTTVATPAPDTPEVPENERAVARYADMLVKSDPTMSLDRARSRVLEFMNEQGHFNSWTSCRTLCGLLRMNTITGTPEPRENGETVWMPDTLGDFMDLMKFVSPRLIEFAAWNHLCRYISRQGQFAALEKRRRFEDKLLRARDKKKAADALEAERERRSRRRKERRAAREAANRQSAPGESGELIQ